MHPLAIVGLALLVIAALVIGLIAYLFRLVGREFDKDYADSEPREK